MIRGKMRSREHCEPHFHERTAAFCAAECPERVSSTLCDAGLRAIPFSVGRSHSPSTTTYEPLVMVCVSFACMPRRTTAVEFFGRPPSGVIVPGLFDSE